MNKPNVYHYCRPETMGDDDYYRFESHLSPEDGEYLASLAAENYHTAHGGWESSWPIEIVLMTQDGATIGIFSVDREARPHFYASEIKTV